jgi:hypothetical protein
MGDMHAFVTGILFLVFIYAIFHTPKGGGGEHKGHDDKKGDKRGGGR